MKVKIKENQRFCTQPVAPTAHARPHEIQFELPSNTLNKMKPVPSTTHLNCREPNFDFKELQPADTTNFMISRCFVHLDSTPSGTKSKALKRRFQTLQALLTIL
jgi:hypothetical protein